jgi:DNA primase
MKSQYVNLQAVKEYVREHSDLVRMIEEDVGHIEFKEEGNGVKVACSPFREEDNPSFKVSGTRFKDWGGQKLLSSAMKC